MKNRRPTRLHLRIFVLIWLILFSMNPMVHAQFSIANMLETQIGNIPGESPDDLKTLYNQFNLRYQINGLSAFIRTEQYHSDIQNPNEYFQLSRFGVYYKNRYVDVKAGHFYETLGRGLLLRGYEIPGSIYEDPGTRSRQAFYKDMQGVSATGRYGGFDLKLIAGRSLQNQLPVKNEHRRNDSILAAQMNYRFGSHAIGGIWMHLNNPYQNDHFASFNVNGTVGEKWSYYAELAKKVLNEQAYFTLNDASSYGAYASVSYSSNKSGFSLEYKDYHNFLIGNGVADPPTLVKEHSYHLLNRSTHVTELLDEQGVQLEVFSGALEDHLFTFNYARSVNDFGLKFNFQEFFIEWATTGNTNWEYKVFADYAMDDFLLENHRFAGGTNVKHHCLNGWTTSLNLEYQRVNRGLESDIELIDNVYMALVFSKSSKFSAAFQVDYTTDSFVEEAAEDGSKLFPSVNLSYRPLSGQTIQLFAGERRGGNACTAGICYEVLDFKGVELRWTAKF